MDHVEERRIRGTIRRCRRAPVAGRPGRNRSAALLVFFFIAFLVGGIWTVDALTGNDVVEAAVTKAQSLADLIGGRSPGIRIEGELTKTRHSRALARMRPRKGSQVAADARAPKVQAPQLAELVPSAPIAGPFELQQPLAVPELTAPPQSLASIVAPDEGTGGLPGGPSGGSPPASFPGPEPKEPVIVPSAVPEPATWAMMLAGFGMLGWHVRRGKRAAGDAEAARVRH